MAAINIPVPWPLVIVTSYIYDALGRVTLTRQDEGGLEYETLTAYDPVSGNVISTTAADGTVTQYQYSSTFNHLEQTCQDAAGLNLCTSYAYDRRGRQEFATDAEGIVQQTVYNRLGLAVQEIADSSGLSATITFAYDDLLNLLGVTDANGNETRYTYTNRGALDTELYADDTLLCHSYSPRGNVAATTLQDGAIISRTYDAANRQIRPDFSSGGFQEFAYDQAGPDDPGGPDHGRPHHCNRLWL